jgi:aminomethyltransferase
MTSELKSTAFELLHIEYSARMVPFSGWNMPVQYSEGIIAEHLHTRTESSLFDCSHMGQFRLKSPTIASDLDSLLPRKASNQKIGTCRYNFLLSETGGVIDDIIVYRLEEDEYYIVVNAGTQDNDASWIQQHLPDNLDFSNESAFTSKLDVQGPKAFDFLATIGIADIPKYFNFNMIELDGIEILLSRTGYTGERGVELYFNNQHAEIMWRKLIGIEGIKPAGLGARDTLRLEMAYSLYGHELNLEVNPIEAGFKGMLHLDREFIGSEALKQSNEKELIAIEFAGKRAAREGAELLLNGHKVGTVSSGSYSPSLQKAIALAFVKTGSIDMGASLEAQVGKKLINGNRVNIPFYKQGTCRQ